MPPLSTPTLTGSNPHYDAGLKHFSQQRFEDAMEAFKAALVENPNHVETQFHIGRVLLETLRAKESIEWFKKTVDRKPGDLKAWMAWAEAVALGGDKHDRADVVSALKLSRLPDERVASLVDRFGARRKGSKPKTGGVSPKDLQRLISTMNAGALDNAESIALSLLEVAPSAAVVANILGEIRSRKGALNDAIATTQQAIKLDGGYTEAYANLGQMYFRQRQWVKAAKVLRLAVILSPDAVAALAGLGTALVRADYLKAGIEFLQRAVALDGKNPTVWAELAHALLRYEEAARAVEAFEMAIKRYKGNAPADWHVGLANALENGGRDDEALEVLDNVLNAEPDNAAATMARAGVLQSRGEFEQAGDLFRKVITLQPTFGEAYWHLVMGFKAASDDPLISEMEQILARDDLAETDRMNLAFALSKVMSDTGHDDQVFQYLNVANGLIDRQSATSRENRFDEIRNCRIVYGPIEFENVPQAPKGAVSPIFVTGLPRSGTTLVEQIIAAHPTVKACGELGYTRIVTRDLLESGSMGAGEAERIADVGQKYTAAVETRFPGIERFTDKSIFTFQHVGPLKRALPNSRFIVVRREPRDNLLSIYKNKFKEGTHGYANDLVTLAKFYDEFDKTIQFWRDRVPEWFYEVSYDALVANPEEESRNLIEACGLDWEDACLDFHNAKTKVKTLSVYQVRQPINKGSVSGWKRFEKDLQPMIDQLRKDGHVTD